MPQECSEVYTPTTLNLPVAFHHPQPHHLGWHLWRPPLQPHLCSPPPPQWVRPQGFDWCPLTRAASLFPWPSIIVNPSPWFGHGQEHTPTHYLVFLYLQQGTSPPPPLPPQVPRNPIRPLLFYHDYMFSSWSPILACELLGTASITAE